MDRLQRITENIQIIEESLSESENKYISENKSVTNLLEQKKDCLSETEQITIDFFHNGVALFDESRQYYRQSAFLLLYAFLEDGLYKICQLIEAHFKHNLSPDDLNGSGIIKYRNYLEKVARIEISNDIWLRLDDYRFVRNQLAHEFGEIDKESKKKITTIVNNQAYLKLDDWGFTGYIKMEEEFLNQVVGDLESLFASIDQQIDGVSKIRIVK